MHKEKVVTDGLTLFCNPNNFLTMSNTTIYISKSELEHFKFLVNDMMNDTVLNQYLKNMRMNSIKDLVSCIKKNQLHLHENIVQTEELEIISGQNLHMVVVNQTKHIGMIEEKLLGVDIDREINDLVYIALSKEAIVVSMSNDVSDVIEHGSLKVEFVNLSGKFDK